MPELGRRDAFWLAALTALVLAFFYQFVILGRIPINADWLQANFEPGRSSLDVAKAHNAELDDPVGQFYPLRMEAVRQWRSGHVPLWNPGILCGSPLLADGISKPFDPLIITQILFGGPTGLGLELVLQFVLMATGMYVLARALDIAPAGAAAAAVVYTFNLLPVTWMELRTATGTFAFFPWAFLFLRAGLEARSLRYAAVAGLFTGAMILAGHPQFCLYALCVLGGFVVWRAAAALLSREPRRGAAIICVGAVALAAGVALSAVETIPFLELVGHSARSPRQYELSNAYAVPVSFLAYFYPNIFGNPARGAYLGAMVLRRSYMTAAIGFTGASTLALAVAGLFLARFSNKRFFITVWIAAPVFILAVGLGIGFAPSGFTSLLAGMDVSRAVFASNFAAAILAGAGVGSLARASWGDKRLRVLCAALGVVFASIVALTLAAASVSSQAFFRDPEQMGTFRVVMSLIRSNSGSILLWPGVYVSLAFFAAASALVFISPDIKTVATLAVGVIAAELILAGVDYNPFVPASLIAPRFRCVEAVRNASGGGRILGVDGPLSGVAGDEEHDDLIATKGDFLLPNTAILYGLEDIRGDESLRLDRYYAYVQRIVGKDVNLLADIHLPLFKSRFIDALNARFILSAAPLEGEGLEQVSSDGKSFVYVNSNALPRAWLAPNWVRASSPMAALNYMHERGDFDPLQTAVVEAADEGLPGPPAAPGAGAARVTSYAPSRVEIETQCSTAAMLVLADAYYPGWKAAVDGAACTVLPADCALRGLYVPAGNHKVIFRYKPSGFAAGAVISLAALITLLAMALARLRGGPRDDVALP